MKRDRHLVALAPYGTPVVALHSVRTSCDTLGSCTSTRPLYSRHNTGMTLVRLHMPPATVPLSSLNSGIARDLMPMSTTGVEPADLAAGSENLQINSAGRCFLSPVLRRRCMDESLGGCINGWLDRMNGHLTLGNNVQMPRCHEPHLGC